MHVELTEAVRRRRMVRSFSRAGARSNPDPARLGPPGAHALRAPTAGNTKGTAWLVLLAAPARRRTTGTHTTTAEVAGPVPAHAGPACAPGPGRARSLCASPGGLCRPLRRGRQRPSGRRAPETRRSVARDRLARSPTGSVTQPSPPCPSCWLRPRQASAACFLRNLRGEAPLLGEHSGSPGEWRLFAAVTPRPPRRRRATVRCRSTGRDGQDHHRGRAGASRRSSWQATSQDDLGV